MRVKARHAETDRRLAAERAQLNQDLRELIAATDIFLPLTDTPGGLPALETVPLPGQFPKESRSR